MKSGALQAVLGQHYICLNYRGSLALLFAERPQRHKVIERLYQNIVDLEEADLLAERVNSAIERSHGNHWMLHFVGTSYVAVRHRLQELLEAHYHCLAFPGQGFGGPLCLAIMVPQNARWGDLYSVLTRTSEYHVLPILNRICVATRGRQTILFFPDIPFVQ